MAKSKLFNIANKSISASMYSGILDEYEQLNAQIKQFWAYQIYNNNHKSLVISTLQSRYTQTYKDIINFVEPSLNPLRRVADIKAVTYAKPPTRRTNNNQLQILLNKNSHKINRSLDYANKVLNYAGNVLIWPCVGLKNGEATEFSLNVIEPHLVYLAPCYNDGRYDIVARYQDYYFVSEYVGDFVGDRRNYVLDKKGVETVLFADLGCPVWASLNETQFGLPRNVSPVNDLIAGTIAINIMESFAEKGAYLKSFLQPIEGTTTERTKADQLIASPNVIWPATVDTIKLAEMNNFYEELIMQRNINLCGQHGISKVIATGDFQNEQSWITISQELLHHYEGSIENWKYIEKQLWENVCEMDLVNIPNMPNIFVKFCSPYPTSRLPEIEFNLNRDKIKAGMVSIDELILEEHPEFSTIEEAKAYRIANLQAYSDEIKLKRDLNISDEGKSPEENGKDGAEAKKAKAFGELGKEGPSMDGKEVEVELIKNENGEA